MYFDIRYIFHYNNRLRKESKSDLDTPLSGSIAGENWTIVVLVELLYLWWCHDISLAISVSASDWSTSIRCKTHATNCCCCEVWFISDRGREWARGSVGLHFPSWHPDLVVVHKILEKFTWPELSMYDHWATIATLGRDRAAQVSILELIAWTLKM